MKTDNELIAEFMGACEDHVHAKLGDYVWFKEPLFKIHLYKKADLKYHTSWDWLMPVVEKIDILYSDNFPPDFLKKILAKEPNGTEPYLDVIALPLSTPIGEAHKAVVEFIKWYNSQKTK